MEEIKQPVGLYAARFPESQTDASANGPVTPLKPEVPQPSSRSVSPQTSLFPGGSTHHVDVTDDPETSQSCGVQLFIYSSGLRRQHAQDKHTAHFLAGLPVNRRAANNNQSRSWTQ